LKLWTPERTVVHGRDAYTDELQMATLKEALESSPKKGILAYIGGILEDCDVQPQNHGASWGYAGYAILRME